MNKRTLDDATDFEWHMSTARRMWPGQSICPDCFRPTHAHLVGGYSHAKECATALEAGAAVAFARPAKG